MSIYRPLRLYVSLLALACPLALPAAGSGAGVWVIRNARIVPVSGPVLERGAVVIQSGLITEVGAEVSTPPSATEIDASGLTLYPGLIDLHTTLGQPDTIPANQGPQSAPQPPIDTAAGQLKAVAAGVTPQWRVATVLQHTAANLAAARAAGVTLALSVPRQGTIAGQAALTRTMGEKAEELPVAGPSPVYFQASASSGRYPGTLMAVMASQRQALLDAQRYVELQGREPKPAADVVSEALAPAVRGQSPVVFVASREREIGRALRLADEFNLRPIIAGGSQADRLTAELARRRTPVLFGLGPLAGPAASNREAAAAPAALQRAGVPLALTSQGASGYSSFTSLVRRVIEAGLPEAQALRALTLAPAEILGIAEQAGSIQAGRSANLILADGPLFDEKTRIRRVFVAGQSVEVPEPKDAPAAKPGASPSPAKPAETARAAEVVAPAASGAKVVLVRNATLLTVARGVIRNGSILIRDGKIAAIGAADTIAAPAGAQVIDATGKWVMPGIVDAHSHMAIEGGINEGTYNITPEVRISDTINPRDVSIYRALAGGVTTAHLMHGSANVIGGQNAQIKMKWGQSAADLLIAGAPRTVKFALGENPKRSNSTRATEGPRRFPTTRIGVENLLRESFTTARAYAEEWEAHRKAVAKGEKPVPPRRDLRLEALAEILAGRILVEAHSYRSDEILMLLRLSEEFGFKIRCLHHALEAYKVAPEIARHGAGISTFADFWGYKVEAFDGIPHNAALCARAGIRVSVNSDSNERVRRLYWEAAKCVKYGGMTEEEALKTITLHPAWQIGLDHRIGSLEVGKDADLAIFSAHPFSPTAVCERTLVEGRVYFDRKDDLARRGKPGYPSSDVEGTLNIGSHECCEGDGH